MRMAAGCAVMYSSAKRSTTAGSMPQILPVYSGVYALQPSTKWSNAVRHFTPSTVNVPVSAGLTSPALMAAAFGASTAAPVSSSQITYVFAPEPASPCEAGVEPMDVASAASSAALSATLPSTMRRYLPLSSRMRYGATDSSTSLSFACMSWPMIQFIMPSASAGSVCGLMPIHSSAMAAVEHWRGSITMIFAPFLRAAT